jgi:mycobactin lysine-N-oxygenase
LILATGADHLALLDSHLEAASRAALLEATGLPTLNQAAVEERIEVDLGLRGLEPRLHLPMLAGLGQGPGFANLSCLGRLADRILESYARPGPERQVP